MQPNADGSAHASSHAQAEGRVRRIHRSDARAPRGPGAGGRQEVPGCDRRRRHKAADSERHGRPAMTATAARPDMHARQKPVPAAALLGVVQPLEAFCWLAPSGNLENKSWPT